MPTIESRKTGEAQYVDMETFKNLQRTGHIRRFVVIDDSDLEPTAVRESRELINFKKKDSLIEPEKIYSREELDKMTKEELEDKFGISAKLYKKVMIDEILALKELENQ